MSTLYRRPLSSLVTDALQKADLLAVEIRKERKNERMNERTNERTKERMNERMNKRKKERKKSEPLYFTLPGHGLGKTPCAPANKQEAGQHPRL